TLRLRLLLTFPARLGTRPLPALWYLHLRMVKEGYYFGVPPLLVGILAAALHWAVLGIILIAFGLFCFSFFRDPERVIPDGPAAIVAPADGRVVVVTDEPNAGRPGTRLSIFLAIWNVHVNRSPAAGVITKVDYRPGKFLAAWDASASTQNEQNVFTPATPSANTLFKQISR